MSEIKFKDFVASRELLVFKFYNDLSAETFLLILSFKKDNSR